MNNIKNYIYSLIYQVINALVPLIVTPYVSRKLGVNGIGTYSHMYATVSYFSMFAMLGVQKYGQRIIAQKKDSPFEYTVFFKQVNFIKVVLTIFWICLYLCFLGLTHSFSILSLILVLEILNVAFDINWFFQGLEEFKKIMSRNIGIQIIKAVLIFFTVKSPESLELYFFILSGVLLIGNISMWRYLPQYLVKQTRSLSIKGLKIHFIQSIIFFIPQIATLVSIQLDKSMIWLITKNAYESGCYEQTQKLINICLSFTIALSSIMISRISYLKSYNKMEAIKQSVSNSLSVTLFFSIPLVFGIEGVIGEFVPFFFGAGYDEIISILKIYCLRILIIGIADVTGTQILLSISKERLFNKIIIVTSIINIALNLLCIFQWGARGAAFATVCSEGLSMLIQLYFVREYINFRLIITKGYKYFFAGIVMFIVICNDFDAGYPGLTLLLKILSGIIIYFFMLIVLKDQQLISTISLLYKMIIQKNDKGV